MPQSLSGNFCHFGLCGAGFGRRSLVAIFQFPFRRGGDRFDCRETGSQGTLGESGGRRHEVHSFGRLFGRHTMRFLSGKAVFGWAFVSGDCVAATDDAGHESLVIRHNRMLRSCSHQE